LKDINSNLKDKITTTEVEIEKTTDPVRSTEGQASVLEMKNLQHNLDEKISGIGK
jgi:hypothetical protein